MHPILFTIGQVSIPTYTVLLDLGLILGLVITYFEGKRALGSGETALDLGLWVVIGGILGGRIGYVLAHWSAFAENWVQVFQIWRGGLSFHGAFFGGVLALLLFSLLQRRKERTASFWQLADVLVPGFALGLVFGWAACLMGGCAYGVLGEGLGYLLMPDLFGVEASRFFTQLVGLAQAGVLFVVFWLMRGRWPFAGAASLLFTLLYFGGQYFLELVRGDEAIYLGPMRLAQVIDLVLALAAAAGLLFLWWRARAAIEEAEEPEEEAAQVSVAEPEGMDIEEPGEPKLLESGDSEPTADAQEDQTPVDPEGILAPEEPPEAGQGL